MENASKALVMAASVLIALMIIGALLLTYNGIKNYQKSETINLTEAQIIEFNNQFSTYNRDDVRGNDLYSLLNRAVDYNTRQTTSGTTTDARENIGFAPITIKVDFKGAIQRGVSNPFSFDGTMRLLKRNIYKASDTQNDFDTIFNGTGGINSIEFTYGKDVATNLVTGITKIFIDDDSNENEKKVAIANFNNISRLIQITSWNDIKEGSRIREDIYRYYEYIQFKRAIFKCTKLQTDSSTGRIIEMDFEFTGKIR